MKPISAVRLLDSLEQTISSTGIDADSASVAELVDVIKSQVVDEARRAAERKRRTPGEAVEPG